MSTTKPDHPSGGVEWGTVRFIRTHMDSLETIPGPGEEWTVHDVDAPYQVLYQLCAGGAIKNVGETISENGSIVQVYKVTEGGHRYLEMERDRREKSDWPVPCHPGISNPRDIDGYQCANEDCEKVYSREEVNL